MKTYLALLLSLACCVQACWLGIDPEDSEYLSNITDEWSNVTGGNGGGGGGGGGGAITIGGGSIVGRENPVYDPDTGDLVSNIRTIVVNAYLPTTLYMRINEVDFNDRRLILLVLTAPNGTSLTVIEPEHHRLLPFFRQGLRVVGDYTLMATDVTGATYKITVKVSAK